MAGTIAGDPSAVMYEVAKRLKETDKNLRKQYLKELRTAAKPLLPAVRRSAAARFPDRGGLARHMSRGGRYRTVARTGASTAGVSIRAERTDPRADSEGRIAHPVPKLGGTMVAAHTVTRTSVKTRKTTTKKVAAKKVGGEFVVDEKGRKVMVVQFFPRAVGFFREPIEEGAEQVRADVITKLDQWVGKTMGA